MRTITLLLLLLSASCANVIPATSSPDSIGEIESASGQASVIRGSRLLEIGPGLKLIEGDAVLTNGEGKALLKMSDGTRFDMGNNTDLTLQQWSKTGVTVLASQGTLNVSPGRNARRASAPFTITTPFAAITPEKGRFWLTHQADHLQVLMLEPGTLTVRNQDGAVTLTGKDEASIVTFIDAPTKETLFSAKGQ